MIYEASNYMEGIAPMGAIPIGPKIVGGGGICPKNSRGGTCPLCSPPEYAPASNGNFPNSRILLRTVATFWLENS